MAMQLPSNNNSEFIIKMSALMAETSFTIDIVNKGDFAVKLILVGKVYKVLETYNGWTDYLTQTFKSLEEAKDYYSKQKACLLFELTQFDILSDWVKPDGTRFRVMQVTPCIAVSYEDSIGTYIVSEDFFWDAIRLS